MLIIVQIVHVMVCITLILFILLQTGKGSDLGAMLGGGGANTVFGAAGAASFLSKLTTYAAVIFVFTCLTLAYISSHPTTAMSEGTTVMPEQEQVLPPASEDSMPVENTTDTEKPAENTGAADSGQAGEADLNAPSASDLEQPEIKAENTGDVKTDLIGDEKNE